MKKIMLGLAPILILVGTFFLIGVLGATAPKPEKKEVVAEPRRYFVEPVRQESVTLTIRTQGEVRPINQIELASQVAGRIVDLSEDFVQGGQVAAGETLVTIDDADYSLTVATAESQVAQAKRALAEEEARAELQRKQWNWEELEQSERPTGLALREPHLAERKAAVRSAEAQLANARENLRRTRISVPFDGRVLERTAGLGLFVSPGQVLGTVFSTDAVQVRLALTDEQLGRLDLPLGYIADYEEARPVRFSANVAGERRQWQGRLVRIDAAVDPQTRLAYAYAELRDPYGANAADGVPMAVGLFVDAEIDGRAFDQALVIPREALRVRNQVYIITEDSRLAVRDVAVIDSSSERAVLRAGVQPGDKVVVSPVATVVEGLKVEAIDRGQQQAKLARLGEDEDATERTRQ